MLLLFYASVTVEGKIYGEVCNVDVDGDCSETNNVCGSSNVCVCSMSTFRTIANTCVNKVSVNATCNNTETATDQCSDANSACSDDGTGGYKCLCTSTYFDSSGTCTLRKKPGEGCASDQCVVNAMCSATNNTCACNTGYEATPTATPTSCENSHATIIIAYKYVFIFGIVTSLYLLV